jgi:RecB family endonuclease NucS
MSERQYATPVLIQESKVVTLHRVDFDDNFHDEDWIQELLFSHPELIPFEELEPAFKGSVPIAREVESGAGPVDVLCVNVEGLLTVVETKLWRNPQSRREVVSQLIHYAAGLSMMGYEDLEHFSPW